MIYRVPLPLRSATSTLRHHHHPQQQDLRQQTQTTQVLTLPRPAVATVLLATAAYRFHSALRLTAQVASLQAVLSVLRVAPVLVPRAGRHFQQLPLPAVAQARRPLSPVLLVPPRWRPAHLVVRLLPTQRTTNNSSSSLAPATQHPPHQLLHPLHPPPPPLNLLRLPPPPPHRQHYLHP